MSFGQSLEDSSESTWPNNFQHAQSERLVEAGKLALFENELFTAERRFSEAMQIAKVNEGLFTETQIPTLELMIETQIAQGNWEAVDTQLEYYAWLNNKRSPNSLSSYLSGIAGMSRLLLAASANVENPSSIRYLIASKNLNWQAISAIESTQGKNSLQLAPWLYNIVLAHYYQSSTTKRRGMTSYEYRSEDEKIVSGWSLRKNESMRISYSIGKDLLERIQALYLNNPQQSPETAGLILVYKGDWEMLFGNKTRALSLYNEANLAFTNNGVEQSSINQFYAATTVLPATKFQSAFEFNELDDSPIEFLAWSPNYIATSSPESQRLNQILPEPEYNALVRFSLDSLTSSLRATESAARMVVALSDLQVLSTTPDNTFVKDLARNEINLLQFRPKFENGIPVGKENIEMQYRFSPGINSFAVSQNENSQ
ncbi:MAG: hypothetical protein GKR91_17165 [Pseudomonadales bacterium]|nr:hypothetical protein [Pseudomonadales bacterium]